MSYAWKNHLCGSTVTESARSRSGTRPASRAESRAAPPYAASTWSHRPSVAGDVGQLADPASTEPVLVDPATAAIANGVRPAAAVPRDGLGDRLAAQAEAARRTGR